MSCLKQGQLEWIIEGSSLPVQRLPWTTTLNLVFRHYLSWTSILFLSHLLPGKEVLIKKEECCRSVHLSDAILTSSWFPVHVKMAQSISNAFLNVLLRVPLARRNPEVPRRQLCTSLCYPRQADLSRLLWGWKNKPGVSFTPWSVARSVAFLLLWKSSSLCRGLFDLRWLLEEGEAIGCCLSGSAWNKARKSPQPCQLCTLRSPSIQA